MPEDARLIAITERLRVIRDLLSHAHGDWLYAVIEDFKHQVAARDQQIASLQQWQPFKTVPKDGTPLLVWADGSHIIHLFWKDDHWEWLGGGRCPDSQYLMSHWMPLPTGPADV